MVKNCATCKHHLGAGACRVNLESECGAGEFEAWESAEAGRACAPCRGCAEREVGCHGRCPRYAKWKEECDGAGAAARLERMANEVIAGSCVQTLERMRKKRGGR